MVSRESFVLAGMAVSGGDGQFDPVRLQKYFFLLDRELAGESGCPHFHFQPCRYGPFDQAVYQEVERLAARKLAKVSEARSCRLHGLTSAGVEQGAEVLVTLPQRSRVYMREASEWVLSIGHRELLASIASYAPDMAVRSVVPRRWSGRREDSMFRDDSVSALLRGMVHAFDWPLPGLRTRNAQPAAALGEHWAAVGDYLREASESQAAPMARKTFAEAP